jgi:hypothetical protein
LFGAQLKDVTGDELDRNRENLATLCTAIITQLVANVEQYPQYVVASLGLVVWFCASISVCVMRTNVHMNTAAWN